VLSCNSLGVPGQNRQLDLSCAVIPRRTYLCTMDDEYKPRTVKGKEQYVVAGGQRNTIMVYDVEGRQTPQDLEVQFQNLQNRRIFLRNKNLKSCPSSLKGNVVYLPHEQVIAVVIEAKFGRAYVEKVFPPSKETCRFTTTTFQEGYLLQQVVGQPFLPFNCTLVKRDIDDLGNVKALLDTAGNIKSNILGPDVLTLDKTIAIPEAIRRNLDKNPWVTWQQPLKIQKHITSKEVPVIYVYAKDPSLYTKVLTYLDGEDHKKGVVGVPLNTSICCGSERCVYCC
jgi:hypothetical protein